MLAARGTREVEGGIERVEDESEDRALRRQARGVYLSATLVALVGTAILWFLP